LKVRYGATDDADLLRQLDLQQLEFDLGLLRIGLRRCRTVGVPQADALASVTTVYGPDISPQRPQRPATVADKSVWLAREFLWDALMGVGKGVTREAVEREIEAIYAPEDAAPATGDVVTA